MQGERGAALLITLVLVTVIGSIAFSVGRSTLTNFRQVTRLEDSLNAYQAAQAGIEDGLLRFRFNKNAETPTTGCSEDVPTTSTTHYARVNLSVGGSQGCVNLSPTLPFINAPSASQIVYDLKMHFRKDAGQQECFIPTVPTNPESRRGCIQLQPALSRDTTVEYDVTGVTQLRISARFKTVANPQLSAQRKLEIIVIEQGATARQELLDASGGQTVPKFITLNNAEKVRIRAFAADLESYELSALPVSASLDSRITTIESVGYFGVSKRKLKLTLDRVSGTVFDVFDFVLFAGDSGIVGPR